MLFINVNCSFDYHNTEFLVINVTKMHVAHVAQEVVLGTRSLFCPQVHTAVVWSLVFSSTADSIV